MEEEKEEKKLYILGTVAEKHFSGEHYKSVHFLNHKSPRIMFCTFEQAEIQRKISSKRAKRELKVIELNPIEDEGTV